MSNVAWIILGQNGKYVTSQNFPADLNTTLQTNTGAQGGPVSDVFCYPDTRGSLIVESNGSVSTAGSFPVDLAQAVSSLGIPAKQALVNVSWQSDGTWAAFCPASHQYKLGPNMPAAVTALLASYTQSNSQNRTRYSPTNLVFSPGGDWLLIGYDQSDEGSGTYNSSTGFPADVLAAANGLPDHTGAASISFDPDGGWAMVDSSNKVTWGTGTPSDVQTAAQSFVQAGNTIASIQFFAIGAYVMPASFSFGLTGPIDPATWTDQSVLMGSSVTQNNGAQKLGNTFSLPSGTATATSGSANQAGQSLLTVQSTTGLAIGQQLTINPGGPTQELATIVLIGNGTIPTPGPGQLLLSSPLQYSHPAGEVVNASVAVITPGSTSWSFAVPASTILIPLSFSFTDDSAKTAESGGFGGAPGGNHGHFSVQIEQVQVGPDGSLVPGPNGELPYWAPLGSPIMVDLYGPQNSNGAGSPKANSPVVGANTNVKIAGANQTVDMTIYAPVPLTTVQSALRLQFVCWLGDTNDEGPQQWDYSYLEEPGVIGDGRGSPGRATIPSLFPSNSPSYTLAQWVLNVIPTDLLQIKAMPVGLLYCPPGNKSSAQFSLSVTNSFTWSFSDSDDNAFSATDATSLTQGTSESGSGSLSLSFFGMGINLGASNSSSTSEKWDSSTTQGNDVSVGNSYTLNLSEAVVKTWTVGSATPWPGDTAPPSQEAFQDDQVLVFVRVQLAVWDYPGLKLTKILGSWPGYYPLLAEDLAAVVNGGAPYSIQGPSGSTPCTLNAADCAALLALDPFYAAGWQGATLDASRYQLIQSFQPGSTVPVSGGATSHNPVALQTVVTVENTYKNSYSMTYSAAIETGYTYSDTSSNSINFGASISEKFGGQDASNDGTKGADSAGGTVSGSVGDSSGQTSSNSQTSTVKVNYSSTAGVDYKSVFTYSGTLDDVNPVTSLTAAAAAGATVLPIASTNGMTVGAQLLINPNYPAGSGSMMSNTYSGNFEVATIASIQTNTSVNLTTPLKNAHVAKENIFPVWSPLQVNAYRDLLYGGMAFQDPNAQRPVEIFHPPGGGGIILPPIAAPPKPPPVLAPAA